MNEDIKQQTKEKIEDKVIKKRLSVQSLENHQEICRFQHKTLDNQKTILNHILGAKTMELLNRHTPRAQYESFSNDSFGQGERQDWAEEGATGVRLKWESGLNSLQI